MSSYRTNCLYALRVMPAKAGIHNHTWFVPHSGAAAFGSPTTLGMTRLVNAAHFGGIHDQRN